jgi:hypothetical protein
MHPTTPLLWMMLCAATATAMRTAMRTISHVNTSLSSIAPFLHPRVWHFCPSDPSFWRERGRTVLALNGLKLHSLLSSPAADLSTHGFTMLHSNAKLAQLVDHTRELLDIVLETDQQDPFLYHVRDNRFGGPDREDILEACSKDSAFARVVNLNATTSVKNMRTSLKALSQHVVLLATKKYIKYRQELDQYENNSNSNTTNSSTLRLHCEELFASHSAIEEVLLHSDTANQGPLDTLVAWLPLNTVNSNPFIIQGLEQWYGTHGLAVGEALLYIAPGSGVHSPEHGTAMLPTDLLEDLSEYRTDRGVAKERRRLIFILRVTKQ